MALRSGCTVPLIAHGFFGCIIGPGGVFYLLKIMYTPLIVHVRTAWQDQHEWTYPCNSSQKGQHPWSCFGPAPWLTQEQFRLLQTKTRETLLYLNFAS